MHRQHYTCMRFPLRRNRSIHAFAPLFYTIKLSSTPDGILSNREVSCFVVALVQSTHGPQIGEMLRTIILKWLSVLGYPQVSVSCISNIWYLLVMSLSEKFDVRHVKWSPDGKSFILLDHSAFCCAFEAVEDSQHVLEHDESQLG